MTTIHSARLIGVLIGVGAAVALVASANGALGAAPAAAATGSPSRLISTLTPAQGGVVDSTTQPATGPTTTRFFENKTAIRIPDASAVASPLPVTGLTGNAPSTLTVSVNIKHGYRGDLVIDLVAPNGAAFRLKDSSATDSVNDVVATYPVIASAVPATGTWRLRVRDVQAGDTGRINSWSLQF